MGQREFIVLIIIAVVILLVVLDIFSRLKVKETVRSNWGKIPYQPRNLAESGFTCQKNWWKEWEER
ncbi:hypothetical protein B1P88_14075 [Enterococcus faecium]|nr:hypothetical protein B1P88_14075 [Enterococcus faecium]